MRVELVNTQGGDEAFGRPRGKAGDKMDPLTPIVPEWSCQQVEQTAAELCPPALVVELLARGSEASNERVRQTLYEASQGAELSAEQLAVLLAVSEPALRAEIERTAQGVHSSLFGRRVRLAAPLCPSNRCTSDCLYCPLRRSNSRLRRTAVSSHQLQREIVTLLDEGHRHLCLVFGDDASGVGYVTEMVAAAFGARSGVRQVRRLDVNLNPGPMADLVALQKSGPFSTYHVYQETYHPRTYARLHPDGSKSDYPGRLVAHHRAAAAGLHDAGLGVLLGAYYYRFDVLSLLLHARHRTQTTASKVRAVSYPRLIEVADTPLAGKESYRVGDDDLAHVVAVTRLALPASDIVLETPAGAEVRRRLYATGVSQVMVGSASYPGVYTADGDPQAAGQLSIGRPRALEELVYRMAQHGFIPNLCVSSPAWPAETASQPTAERRFAAATECSANALLALKEYLMDYAASETQAVGEQLIERELTRLPAELRQITLDLMEEAEAGLRGQRV